MEKISLTKTTVASSEEEEEKAVEKPFLAIDPGLEEKLKEVPGALEYISKLLKTIRKCNKKITKLRNKLIKLACRDAWTQTDENEPDSLPEVEAEGNVKSFTDDIKEAAQAATQNLGFVYEETSGMYYDYNTGYYYNAEYGLYYDDKNRMYLQYNTETGNYEFHSSVAAVGSPKIKSRKNKSRHKTKVKQTSDMERDAKRRRNDDSEICQDFEEGECSDSDAVSSEDGTHSDSSELSKQWPPCIRVIVKSSENSQTKVGTLYVLTCDGGTLGREGDHSILIPDASASKHHLRFFFDRESDCYKAIDLGSRNGTLLDGKRMSPSKQESEPIGLAHGTEIKIGSTVLVCHVHNSGQTCRDCEPGLLQSKVDENGKAKESKTGAYRNQLRDLKKMYGLNYQPELKLAHGYKDRAQERRETVGSQNPHEKTQVASVNESITKENKGFKLLAKMGWKEGDSLGKDGEGILEPIKVEGNVGHAGIGSDNIVPVKSSKQTIWRKTQERFDRLPDHNEV